MYPSKVQGSSPELDKSLGVGFIDISDYRCKFFLILESLFQMSFNLDYSPHLPRGRNLSTDDVNPRQHYPHPISARSTFLPSYRPGFTASFS